MFQIPSNGEAQRRFDCKWEIQSQVWTKNFIHVQPIQNPAKADK